MLRNYLLITFRVFRKYGLFTLINLLGLTLGLVCILFIYLWIQDEWSYDRFHTKTDQLYQLIREEQYNDGSYEYLTATPGLLGPTLEHSYSEIENTCRVGWSQDFNIRYGEKIIKRSGRFVDPSFFSMFSFPIVHGESGNPLENPKEIVITETMAADILGDQNPVGGVLEVRGNTVVYQFKIGAVVQDFPANSFTNGLDFVIPYQEIARDFPWLEQWSGNALDLYIELAPGTDLQAFNEQIADIVRRHTDNESYDVYLQPLKERHLYADIQPVKDASGGIVYLRLFAVVGLFILVLACINFTNFTTARSSTRLVEIGVRKAMGATGGNLTNQFFSEAAVMIGASMGLALLLASALVPVFNNLVSKEVGIPWDQTEFYAVIGLLMVVGILLSGTYPAFYLSAFKTNRILKGKFPDKGLSLRKTLVLVQFTISLVLMIATWMVYRQVEYFQNKNLGLNKEHIMFFQTTNEIQRNQEVFSSLLSEKEVIQSVTFSRFLPTDVRASTSSPNWRGKRDIDEVEFQILGTGLNFLTTTGIKIKEGRDFNSLADTSKVLINSTAAKLIGIEEVVGEPISFYGQNFEVMGVVEDFHANRLHEPIEPLIIRLNPPVTEFVLARIVPGNPSAAIREINSLFKDFSPYSTFDFHFLDQTVEATYEDEKTIGKLALIFTIVAMAISCLGLFGLAAFSVERRKKETGIRKVLGANTPQIFYLFSREFIGLIIIALLIAGPVSWWLSNRWLSNFYYHTDFRPVMVLIAGMVALSIALLTITWHALKAAHENPVEALRDE